jgi:hypothetical protein
VAAYGAFVATLVAAFQVYQWREQQRQRRRRELSRLEYRSVTVFGNADEEQQLLVRVVNESEHDLGLTGGVASAGHKSVLLEIYPEGSETPAVPPLTLPSRRGAQLRATIPPNYGEISSISVSTDDGRFWFAPDTFVPTQWGKRSAPIPRGGESQP